MPKIVAIGGGEIGRPGQPVETTAIDEEIIELSGKKHPRLLLLPTASSDSPLYFKVVKKHFGDRLGCRTDVLYLIGQTHRPAELKDKILGADIIYVGGGNTEKMMRWWRKTGVDKLLQRAYQQGIVLSGVSAGAICWFKWGESDSRQFNRPEADYIKVRGLNLVKAGLAPHFDVKPDRRSTLKRMMVKTSGVAIGLDNCAAIEIVNDQYRIINSKTGAGAKKIFWKRNRYHQEAITPSQEYLPLTYLLRK